MVVTYRLICNLPNRITYVYVVDGWICDALYPIYVRSVCFCMQDRDARRWDMEHWRSWVHSWCRRGSQRSASTLIHGTEMPTSCSSSHLLGLDSPTPTPPRISANSAMSSLVYIDINVLHPRSIDHIYFLFLMSSDVIHASLCQLKQRTLMPSS